MKVMADGRPIPNVAFDVSCWENSASRMANVPLSRENFLKFRCLRVLIDSVGVDIDRIRIWDPH